MTIQYHGSNFQVVWFSWFLVLLLQGRAYISFFLPRELFECSLFLLLFNASVNRAGVLQLWIFSGAIFDLSFNFNGFFRRWSFSHQSSMDVKRHWRKDFVLPSCALISTLYLFLEKYAIVKPQGEEVFESAITDKHSSCKCKHLLPHFTVCPAGKVFRMMPDDQVLCPAIYLCPWLYFELMQMMMMCL